MNKKLNLSKPDRFCGVIRTHALRVEDGKDGTEQRRGLFCLAQFLALSLERDGERIRERH